MSFIFKSNSFKSRAIFVMHTPKCAKENHAREVKRQTLIKQSLTPKQTFKKRGSN